MTYRSRFLLTAGAWAASVTAALVVVPLVLRARLPEPLATHWGPPGAPDGASSFWAALGLQMALWAVFAGLAAYTVLRGDAVRHRARRKAAAAMLAGGAGLALGTQWTTLGANLGRATWRDAGAVGGRVPLVLAGAVLLGVIGRLLASAGPGDPPEEGAARLPRLRLRADRRSVWVSAASNRWMSGLCLAALAGLAVLAVLGLVTGDGRIRDTAVPLVIVAVVGWALSTVGARVSEQGLVISFGPFQWPTRTIPLDKIQSARAEVRHPLEVGGWGIRGLPGASTIMIRGGECLVVRYTSGGELAVSVDDAARGAALLNALVSARPAVSP
ncbi:DUF1648 domain-containing protein [Sphaerisporangium sp. NPDC005288]|uniref:DUF1648 domain-containing protein n=1 Tax=Sphaerisporangium sp. NPDC005288 TaxID=3155114 RepID=UPI0033A0B3B8